MMRRLIAPAVLLAAVACAGPRPCTQTLCPARVEGAYRIVGWNRSVTVDSTVPALPIVADSSVEILNGEAEFTNDRAVLRASAGAMFRFDVSSSTPRISSVLVSSGVVTVEVSSAPPSTLTPGIPYLLASPK